VEAGPYNDRADNIIKWKQGNGRTDDIIKWKQGLTMAGRDNIIKWKQGLTMTGLTTSLSGSRALQWQD
jgi:hypothetical protein